MAPAIEKDAKTVKQKQKKGSTKMSDRMGKAIYGERLKKLGLVCFPGEDTTELSLRKRQKP